jgi:hypothetical protein
MNIFNNLRIYADKWEVKSTRAFTQEEIDTVSHAVVVDSTYGASVQFTRKNGGLIYIPLSQDSSLGIGEEVDLTKAKILTLSKSGEADIFRVFI